MLRVGTMQDLTVVQTIRETFSNKPRFINVLLPPYLPRSAGIELAGDWLTAGESWIQAQLRILPRCLARETQQSWFGIVCAKYYFLFCFLHVTTLRSIHVLDTICAISSVYLLHLQILDMVLKSSL